jgi:protoheme ferro-lyase
MRRKFLNLIFKHTDLYDSNFSKECEKIADNYAIEFAEWLYKWDNTRLPNGNWIIKLGLKPYTSEEVLEVYKKEKEKL